MSTPIVIEITRNGNPVGDRNVEGRSGGITRFAPRSQMGNAMSAFPGYANPALSPGAKTHLGGHERKI